MAGVDTVRGIEFQQAYAVYQVVSLLDDRSVAAVRVEGVEDIVDIEILGDGGVLQRAIQAKTRSRRAWTPAELKRVLDKWADSDSSESADFDFVTNGDLGPGAEAIREALTAARQGDPAAVEELFAEATGRFYRAAARSRIITHSWHADSLMGMAERRLSRLSMGGAVSSGSAESPRVLVNELFRSLLRAASNPDPAHRLVRMDELAHSLGVDRERHAYSEWDDTLRGLVLAGLQDARPVDDLAVGRGPNSGVIISVDLIDERNEKVSIGSVPKSGRDSILHGHSGSGKTTALRQMGREAARAHEVTVLAHAEAYVPGRLDVLVADALTELSGVQVSLRAAEAFLLDQGARLMIDGVSEIPAGDRGFLGEDLHALNAGSTRVTLVLCGRNVADVRPLLWMEARPRTYQVAPLDETGRLQLTRRVLDETRSDGTLSSNDEAADLLFQIETRFGDNVENTLLLRLALLAHATTDDPSGRVETYRAALREIVRRTGAQSITHAMYLAGIAYSKLLDESRRYADEVEWSMLLHQAGATLRDYGIEIDVEAAARTLDRSGLVARLGYDGRVVPIHDSIADYFSALAIKRGFAELPRRTSSTDEQRIGFLLELGHDSAAILELIVSDNPFSIARLARWDRPAEPIADLPSLISSLISRLVPERHTLAYDIWRQYGGLTFFPTSSEPGWLTESEATARASESRFLHIRSLGAMPSLDFLWRRYLVGEAFNIRRNPSVEQNPTSVEQAIELLRLWDARQAEAVDRLIDNAVRDTLRDEIRRAVGGSHIQVMLWPIERDAQKTEASHPVHYRYGASFAAVEAPIGRTLVDRSPYHSHTAVESLLSKSPEGEAVRRLEKALASLTRTHWL